MIPIVRTHGHSLRHNPDREEVVNMDAFVRLYDMPCTVKSYAKHNQDGSYTIVINSRLSFEQQQTCYRHEMEHISNMDFYGRKSVDKLEKKRHWR